MLLALAAAAAATSLVLRDDAASSRGPVAPSEAAPAAAVACGHVQRVEELVARNASITQVREALREAERAARRAAQGDPSWLALSGGISSLRIAVEADDERVARTGIDVVRTECRRTR